MRRALVLAVLIPACAGGENGGDGATVRDSAGIEIVENAGPAFATPQWAVSAQPEVVIGVVEGDPDEQLYQARDAVRLRDGRIVVANAGTHELRWYGPDGRFIRSAGGEGGGPGEFGGLGSVARYGADSLMVHDWRHRRVSVFDTSGTFGRSFLLELSAGTFPTGVEFLPDGRVVASSGGIFTGEAEAGLARRPVPRFLMSGEGELLDSLGEYPGWESWVRQDGDRMGVTGRAFGRSGIFQALDDWFYFGATERAELRLHRLSDRTLLRLVRWSALTRPVTPEDIAAYRREQIDEAEERWRDMQREMLEGMPYPETFPVFSMFMVDPTNHVWVRAYPKPGEEPPRWWVFDPDGRLLFTIATPPDVRIAEIGRDYLLGIVTDELDVEHVVVYGLDRGTIG